MMRKIKRIICSVFGHKVKWFRSQYKFCSRCGNSLEYGERRKKFYQILYSDFRNKTIVTFFLSGGYHV